MDKTTIFGVALSIWKVFFSTNLEQDIYFDLPVWLGSLIIFKDQDLPARSFRSRWSL